MARAPRIPTAKPALGGSTGAPSRILTNPVKGSFDDPAGPIIGVGTGPGRAAVVGATPGLTTSGAMSRGGISRSSIRRSMKPKF